MKTPFTLSERFQNMLCRLLSAPTPETAAVRVFNDRAEMLPQDARPKVADFDAWISALVTAGKMPADLAAMYRENADAFAVEIENGVARLNLKQGHRLP